MDHVLTSALNWARGRPANASRAAADARTTAPRIDGPTVARDLLLRSLPFQRGVAGVGHVSVLAALGCNALRTWGADQLSPALLDECSRCGVRVWAGLWIQSAPPAGSAHDAARAAVVARAVGDVHRWRHHAAIVAWVVGNEVELRSGSLADALATIRAAAAGVAAADPGRLVATAVADGGVDKWRTVTAALTGDNLHGYGPATGVVDVLLVNAYGGLPGLHAGLTAGGYRGAYAAGEGLTLGHWEAPVAPWGAPLEPPSGGKARLALVAGAEHVLPAAAALAARRRGSGGGASSSGSGGGAPVCVGSFAFFGGHKVEVTPSWYSLFTADGAPDGPRLAALGRLWRAAEAVEAGALPLARAQAELLQQPRASDAAVACNVPAPSGVAVNGAVAPNAHARCGDVVTVQVQLAEPLPLTAAASAGGAAVVASWEVWTDGSADGGGSGGCSATTLPRCVLHTGALDAAAPVGLRMALPPGRYRVVVTVRRASAVAAAAAGAASQARGPLAPMAAAVATANVPLLLSA
jgi:hypothetical protein